MCVCVALCVFENVSVTDTKYSAQDSLIIVSVIQRFGRDANRRLGCNRVHSFRCLSQSAQTGHFAVL